ncbi:glycosyltransferase family 2 protein [bacterium]|nr:glycosyltransferase family 2 protein [bacterium]
MRIYHPKAYIMMRAHNVDSFIEKSINSVLNQDYKNLKLIILNDNSTDNTLNIINKKAKDDNRIEVISANNNSAALSAEQIMRYTASKVFNTDFVFMLDSDDFFSNSFVISDVMEKVAQTKANICGLGFHYEFADDNAKNLILQAGMGVPHNSLMKKLSELSSGATVSENKDIATNWDTPMWNKAIRGDMFKRYVSLLPSFDRQAKVCEDFPTTLLLLFKDSKLTAVDDAYAFFKHYSSSTVAPVITDFTVDRIGFLNITNGIYKNNKDLFAPEAEEVINNFISKKYDVISSIVQTKINQGFLNGFSVAEFQRIFKEKIK